VENDEGEDLGTNRDLNTSIALPLSSNLAGVGDPVYITQLLELKELRFLSQPPGVKGIDSFPHYMCQKATREAFLYYPNLGVDPEIADLTESLGRGFPGDDSPDGESTATASKAVGYIRGAAKEATLVVVKMAALEHLAILEALQMTINDVRSKRRQGMAVVILSWSSPDRKPFDFARDYVWNMIKGLIAEMAALDIVVVCAAGNAKSRTPNADTAPAILLDFHTRCLLSRVATTKVKRHLSPRLVTSEVFMLLVLV